MMFCSKNGYDFSFLLITNNFITCYRTMKSI
nr:MAG TPA: hypothetical protein [Caudoviricetes sp.]